MSAVACPASEFQTAFPLAAEKPREERWAEGQFALYRGVLRDADEAMEILSESVEWQQRHIHMYGRSIPLPRLVAWYGDADATYTYSGIRTDPKPWTPDLLRLKDIVEAYSGGVSFNSVLLNLYRDGSDSLSWHSDDEPELGREPTMASLNLGASRLFRVRPHRKRSQIKSQSEAFGVMLDAGSLLVMRGRSQMDWEHSVPKARNRAIGPRINLTFRVIL